MQASKRVTWGSVAAGLGVLAGIAGLITFASGKNLPDFFPSPAPSQSPDASDVAMPPPSQPAVEPTTDETEPTVRTISAIRLPSDVFSFQSFMNETRQSHTLNASDVGSGAYVYGYWEDPESIWLDATVASGDEGLSAVSAAQDQVSSTAQLVSHQGATTCAWLPDSDPNTPRHSVRCFRIDTAREIGMVTETHTATVGEVDPFNLLNEIWANLETS